ncbi:polysaccharide deacetylase family protein [Sphaerisporangium album]|uniref:Polysaccharide deacetylase family protein n=1 Tax=Sphaerisporangium album TaxID=509200 RepID=A0A367FMD1_9ACTN|nr:polysaccharide deacetylase family protein [Sphaerisporangium album]RCG31546.1 polysaccharide deacetylase family protein [Sphaerisporangium album]
MSRSLLAGAIALAVVLASGCGISLPLPTVDGPSTLPAQPTTINFVDPSTVPGLTIRTTSDDSAGTKRVFASYPVPADAPALAAELQTLTDQTLRRYARRPADRSHTPAPVTAPSELNIGWQITAASDGVFGVRLRTGALTGGAWRSSLNTVWYDQTTRRVHSSSDLLKDRKALATLAALVKNRLWKLGPGVRPDAIGADGPMFDSLNFNPHGDLVAEFDDDQVAAARMGRIAVAIPMREAEPLLSAFGTRVMRAVDSATPRTLPDTPPPQATPVPGLQSPDGASADCSATRCVALTFDDGPSAGTDRLMALLAEYRARATFFTVGQSAEARPDLLRRMSAAGHLVAGHSWSHRDLDSLDVRQISDELGRTQIAIGAATGRAPGLMRAPYGHVTAKVINAARALGLSIAGWNVDAADARDGDPAAVARRTVEGVRPGAIVLMHDCGRATLRALPRILSTLAARGYSFVTVPELYASQRMVPGQVYTEGVKPAALRN